MADPFVVASFNIRNGRAFDGWNSWPFRRAATAAAIGSLDAHVIGLQEVYRCQLRYLLRRLPGYTAVGAGRNANGAGEHTPVLSRFPVLEHTTRFFDVTGARFPRIATTARLQIGDRTLAFTSTHLDERSARRRRESVRQLLEWLADAEEPQVIVGDFNDTLDDAMFITLADAGFRSALPADAPGTSHHFTGRVDGRRIDHILVSRSLEVLEAGVITPRPGGRVPSDHWPVTATLRLR